MTNRFILKWAGIVTVLLVGSRLLGFLREMAIAYRFGTTAETDAYLVAAVIPSILFFSFNETVKTAFIPVYGEYHNREDGDAFALTVFVLLGAILLLISVVLVVSAPLLIRIVAPGFTGETFEMAVRMSRILLPGLVFMGLTGLSSGVLHTKKNFLIPAVTAYPSNIIIMFSAVVLGARFGIMGLTWGTIIGFASQFLAQIPSLLRMGIFRGKKLLWRHPGLKKMAVVLPPVILGAAAVELKTIIDRAFGSLLPEGSIAALNFSSRIFLMPNSIIIVALLTVLYPTMVELKVDGKIREFKEMLRQGLGLIILLVFPIMVGLIVLRVPVVSLLFQRGAFDAQATGTTAFALAFYSLGLLALGMQLLLHRAFYSYKDTLVPMYVTLLMMGLNVLFNWLLIKPMAHGGIALGTALATNIGTVILGLLLHRKIGPFGGHKLLSTFLKSGVAALLMGLVVSIGSRFLSGEGFLRQAVDLGILIGFGGVVYFALAYTLKISELHQGLNILKKRIKIN